MFWQVAATSDQKGSKVFTNNEPIVFPSHFMRSLLSDVERQDFATDDFSPFSFRQKVRPLNGGTKSRIDSEVQPKLAQNMR